MRTKDSLSEKLTPIQKKLIAIAGVAGMLEFYDFIIYALLAGYITEVFFPAKDYVTSLIATFATFSLGYLVRPIGGVIFGHFGDKYGRKKVYTLSVFIMAIATFSIGLVPSYASIGIAAPILILSLRLIQGFSVGGQIPGGLTYISEAVSNRKAFATGILFSFIINGITLGGVVNASMTSLLSHASIISWGWRLPFFLGGIIGWVSYAMRRHFFETLDVELIRKNVRYPIVEVVKSHWAATIRGSLLIALGACHIALYYLFTPAYLTKLLHYPSSEVNWSLSLALFLSTWVITFFGWLSDRVSKKKLSLVAAVVAGIMAYPIFYSFASHLFHPLIPLLVTAVVLGMIWGPVLGIAVELFEMRVRFTAIAVIYNIGFAIFGGLAPLIGMALISWTDQMASPAYYMIFTAILAFIAALTMSNGRKAFGLH